ncbi:MAG: FxSxx-COOH system tetratricopeptide repeat protein [Chloroflexota bacterium]
MSAEKFAQLLTEGIYRIHFVESKKIQAVQDEIGYTLKKRGGASVEHWRKGHIPAKSSDIETLAREIVRRGGFDRDWLEAFLRNANYLGIDMLCDELFPPSPSVNHLPTSEEKLFIPDPPSDIHLQNLPLDVIPDLAALPKGSLMPLSKNPLFVGRESDLSALALALKSNGAMTISQVETAAATGLGGIGKTQLASEFVHRYGQFFDGGVFWLSFDNPDAVPAEIAACGDIGAMELRSDFGKRPLAEQVKLVQAAWQNPVPRLLVFDNCEDPALLAQWRPSSGGCRVLVTSRYADWEIALGVQTLALGVLTRSESIQLLQNHCPDVNRSILNKISEELGDLPLALHLAGRYLQHYKRSVKPITYLDQLQDPLLLHHASMQGGEKSISPTGHSQHVGRTFALSYDRLDPANEIDVLARKLLVHTAHFAPGEPIWYQLLIQTLSLDDKDPDALRRADQAFQRLNNIGLIETEENSIFHMHRLVAKFVRDVAKGEVEATQNAVEAVVFKETVRRNKEVHPLPLLSWQLHLRSVVDIAKAREDEEGARLCYELGQHLWQISDFQGALQYHQKALAIRENIFGEDHPETAESLVSIGRVIREFGRPAETKPYFERSLAIRMKIFGKYHRDTAESLENIGRCLLELGDPNAGLPYIKSALEIIQITLGEQDALAAEYHNNLGFCLYNMGDKVNAANHYIQAMTINEAVLGPEHPFIALNCHNLGLALCDLGDFTEAKIYLERALATRRGVYGNDQRDTIISINAMAILYYHMGQLAEAKRYAIEALEKFTKLLGENHVRTSYSQRILGKILHGQDNPVSAKKHLQKAFDIRKQALGEDHYHTQEILSDLAELMA